MTEQQANAIVGAFDEPSDTEFRAFAYAALGWFKAPTMVDRAEQFRPLREFLERLERHAQASGPCTHLYVRVAEGGARWCVRCGEQVRS